MRFSLFIPILYHTEDSKKKNYHRSTQEFREEKTISARKQNKKNPKKFAENHKMATSWASPVNCFTFDSGSSSLPSRKSSWTYTDGNNF